ncbi:hypothetical protein QJS66_11740 [Kocuria rhizophila]|nr:hypothetical protein QJS66_11740 [Kocuria rhizophila]
MTGGAAAGRGRRSAGAVVGRPRAGAGRSAARGRDELDAGWRARGCRSPAWTGPGRRQCGGDTLRPHARANPAIQTPPRPRWSGTAPWPPSACGSGGGVLRYRGKDHAITVTAFADMLLSPPTMLVCLSTWAGCARPWRGARGRCPLLASVSAPWPTGFASPAIPWTGC